MNSEQKKILKQTGVSHSQYLQNIASLNSSVNDTNEGIKNNSYQRYLNRKKGKVLSNQGKNVASEPHVGNKTQSVSLTSKNISSCSPKLCN